MPFLNLCLIIMYPIHNKDEVSDTTATQSRNGVIAVIVMMVLFFIVMATVIYLRYQEKRQASLLIFVDTNSIRSRNSIEMETRDDVTIVVSEDRDELETLYPKTEYWRGGVNRDDDVRTIYLVDGPEELI